MYFYRNHLLFTSVIGKKKLASIQIACEQIDISKTSCYLKSFLPSTCKSKENIMQITEVNSVSRLQVIT